MANEDQLTGQWFNQKEIQEPAFEGLDDAEKRELKKYYRDMCRDLFKRVKQLEKASDISRFMNRIVQIMIMPGTGQR